MSYRAKVIKVMIASPSDVLAEREAIRHVMQEWNFAHSEDKNIVLMPVGWESHATPSIGGRPQAIINRQILAGCDLLIAVFWTRLGTPTRKAVSGTVEEIEKHVKAKKPAMIYFSSVPVLLESVDPEQYRKLGQFKEEIRKRGLYTEYESPEDFRSKLSRQLAQTVIRYFTSKKNGNDESAEDLAIAPPKLPRLSESAKRLLMEAAQDSGGVVLRIAGVPYQRLPIQGQPYQQLPIHRQPRLRRGAIHDSAGLMIQTNGSNLVDSQDPRTQARWDGALAELRNLGLLEDRGYKGQVFSVTDEGYRVADLLRERPLQQFPPSPPLQQFPPSPPLQQFPPSESV